MQNNLNSTGSHFSLQTYLKCRVVAKKIVNEASELVEVGMGENDGIELIEQLMNKYGVSKKWHPTKFRIGNNTAKSFKELSEPKIRLQKSDIFFIDIGPVLEGHEADYGETFVKGENIYFQAIAYAARKLHALAQKEWKLSPFTGKKLYLFLENEAKKLGYQLNLKMGGHRLGDFPHHVYFRGALKDVDQKIIPNLWILEVLIQHPIQKYGAFYEDLLIMND